MARTVAKTVARVVGASYPAGTEPAVRSGMLFEDIQAFLVVARTMSFSAAALRLRIAQSSLSKRVQRLEQYFGTPLFVRHGRGVSLTAAGTVLLARAEGLVQEIEDVERDVRGIITEPAGVVRIAIPPATGPALAPRVFARCVTDHPKISPQLREGTTDLIHEWINAGEVDIALMYNPELGPDVETVPLVTEPLFLIAPATPKAKALSRTQFPDECAIDDLARLPLILPRSPHSIRVLIDRLCAGNNIHPNIVYESDSIRSTRGIVEIGIGCTVFGRSSLASQIDKGTLTAIPFKSALASWTLCLVHPRRDNLSLAVRTVKRIIIDQVTAMHATGFWQGSRLHSVD
jgi:LysR family nitrogen assimilation transcriptional regulator